ncbi:MAG: collagen binding domain-containing protein [Candidatus Thorarchaeota archaeon]
MSKLHRAFTFLFLVLFAASIAIPVSYSENLISHAYQDTSFEPAATNYVVDVRVYNNLLAFNDDDFEFRVRNGTTPLNNAWVRLYNVSTGLLEDETQTDGNGYALFSNLPRGIYQWNVSHDTDSITPQETGQIVSDGPEAIVSILFGNIDWENDEDDLNATITDIEGNPAQNLNFSIHRTSDMSIYAQVEVTDGTANFADLPQDNYTWRLSVLYDPTYDGYLLDEGEVESNGTQLLAHQSIGPITGNPDHLDLEVFAYYETSLSPIVGADVQVTFKNGTVYDSKVTPANGTVIFVDLPIEFINWTIYYMGQPVGLGDYFYNLTAVESDVRDPIITSPGDVDVLIDAENVTLTWTVEDEYPSSIEVWIDNHLNATTSWVNTTFDYVYNVSASFPEFIIGEYEVRLFAYDLNSNFAEDIITLRFYENVTPVIEGPDPVEFTFSESGYTLSWNVTDDYPDKYQITRNEESFENGTIDPDNPVIEISLNDLEIGVHNFSLFVNDTSGNTAMDSVLVTVLGDEIAPVISYSPQTIRYAQGAQHQIYNWTASDDFQDYYEILLDGVVVVTEDWTTTTIEFDFSGLPQGQHNVTLRVYDLGGNMAESIVMVYVTTSTAMVYLTSVALLAVGVIAIIGVIWFFKYR